MRYAATIACALLVGALGVTASGCGTGGGSLVYDAGYTAGTIIDSLVIQPAIAPDVSTTVTASDSNPNEFTLRANASGLDTPFRYAWQQTAGEKAQIANTNGDVATVTLPEGATGEFVFVVTVTDAGGRKRQSEVRVDGSSAS